MPEIYGTILTKSELRDVVEYLATLKADNTPRLDTSVTRRRNQSRPRSAGSRLGRASHFSLPHVAELPAASNPTNAPSLSTRSCAPVSPDCSSPAQERYGIPWSSGIKGNFQSVLIKTIAVVTAGR
jgi:hypothetical protein